MRLRADHVQCYVVRNLAAGGEFLQLRRRQGDILGETWQCLHGGVREGETAWQAALRELEEETGLYPIEFYQLDTVNTFYRAGDDAVWMCPGFCAIVPASAAVGLNEEHDEYRWLTRNAFLDNLMWPGERQAFAELCREILADGPAKPHLRVSIPPRV